MIGDDWVVELSVGIWKRLIRWSPSHFHLNQIEFFWISSSNQIVGRHPFPVLSLDVTRRTDFKRMHIMTRILYCIARHSSVGLSESFWAVLIACEEIKAGFSFIYAMTCVDEEFWVSCPPSLNRSKTYHGVRQLISTHDLPRLKGLLFDFCTWRHVFAKALLIIQILQKAEGLSTHKHTADGSLFDRCIGDCPFSDDSCIEIWWNKILFEFNWVEGSPLHQNNLAKQPTLPAKMCIAAHREKHGSDCARRRLGKTWVIRRLLDKLKMATGIGFSMTRICTLSSSILDFGRNHNHRILGMLRED